MILDPLESTNFSIWTLQVPYLLLPVVRPSVNMIVVGFQCVFWYCALVVQNVNISSRTGGSYNFFYKKRHFGLFDEIGERYSQSQITA